MPGRRTQPPRSCAVAPAVLRRVAGTLALALAGSLVLHGPMAQASPPSTTAAPAQPGAAKAPASRAAPSGSSRAGTERRSGWGDLSAAQQQALQPLAGAWPTLSEAQKRKWIALSRNYQRMTPDDQARLHSRMTGWVALSPQQRTQARLNFAETKGLSADDKKAKWEAYQALSPEEKRKLAAGAPARTPPAAAALKPVPPQKLATVPRAPRKSRPPRVAPVATPASAPPVEAPPASPAPVPAPVPANPN